MKTIALLLVTTLLLATSARSETVVWVGAGGGPGDATGRYWGDAANWTGAPEGATGTDCTAVFDNAYLDNKGQRNLLLANSLGQPISIVIGNLSFKTVSSGNRAYTINSLGDGDSLLIFDSGVPGTNCKLALYSAAENRHVINAAIELISTLEIQAKSPAQTTSSLLLFRGAIAGSGGILMNKANEQGVTLAGVNTYSGPTVVSAGRLTVSPGGSLGQSDTWVYAHAELVLKSADSLDDTRTLTLHEDARLALDFTGADTVGRLKIGGASIGDGTYDAAALSARGVRATGQGMLIVTSPSDS